MTQIHIYIYISLSCLSLSFPTVQTPEKETSTDVPQLAWLNSATLAATEAGMGPKDPVVWSMEQRKHEAETRARSRMQDPDMSHATRGIVTHIHKEGYTGSIAPLLASQYIT